MNILIITSTSLRHHYLANSLAENFNLVGVVSEEKKPILKNENPDKTIREYFLERGEKEALFFEKQTEFKIEKDKILSGPYGLANEKTTFDWVVSKNPEYLVLFGCSIIRDPLLTHFKNRIINMHLGLSPYYRGAGTNFWPLVFREPECVGVTVHLATAGVDAGPILGQARPGCKNSDTSHDLGNKTIVAGKELLSRALIDYKQNKVLPQPQDLNIGRVFKNSDLTAEAILKMRENFQTGMIEEYLAQKEERCKKFPIIEY